MKLPQITVRALSVGAALALFFIPTNAAFAQSICNAGDQVVATQVDITQSCTITGSLTVLGVLRVNFDASPGSVLRVEGDIGVRGGGILWVEGGTLEIQQDHNRHRQLWTTDDATVILKSTTLVLNQGTGTKYLVHYAVDRSKMIVVDSSLDRTMSWLISDYRGQSTLVAIRTRHIPTEIYVKDGSTVSIAEPSSHTGVWLDFNDGASGTINLPVQIDAVGELRPYAWRIGRGSPELSGVGWQLEIANASVGLGLESHTGSRITVNGQGAPASGEIKIAYHAEVGVQTLFNLGTGLQNRTLGVNQLTLRNVELGPIAWQLYAHNNATLTLSSSIVNEIGVSNGGHITVGDSIVQFGSVTSLGLSATIAVHNSQIYAQTIEAQGTGVVDIYDSAVYGAAVVSHETAAIVNFHRGALLYNDADSCPLVLGHIVDGQGIPNCNPFLPPGAPVTRAGSGDVSCNGTYNCTW